jgi:hypothetical protein
MFNREARLKEMLAAIEATEAGPEITEESEAEANVG